jgi:hypothetical protein
MTFHSNFFVASNNKFVGQKYAYSSNIFKSLQLGGENSQQYLYRNNVSQ